MRELRPGVWHWEAPHPDWTPDEDWDEVVSSYAIEGDGRLLLFDPLALPPEVEERAAGLETAIVLTCPWHERDSRILVERLGAPIFTPAPDSQQDLMGKYSVTADEAGEGSPDVRWLKDDDAVESHFVSAGDRLPVGVEAFPGIFPNDLVLWVQGARALVTGDTLLNRGAALEINERWLPEGVTLEDVVGRLRPHLELPVELVLATHGGPADRAALERALS